MISMTTPQAAVLAWATRELDRQLDDLIAERRRLTRQAIGPVVVYPCGCGLKNDVCTAHLDALSLAAEIPF